METAPITDNLKIIVVISDDNVDQILKQFAPSIQAQCPKHIIKAEYHCNTHRETLTIDDQSLLLLRIKPPSFKKKVIDKLIKKKADVLIILIMKEPRKMTKRLTKVVKELVETEYTVHTVWVYTHELRQLKKSHNQLQIMVHGYEDAGGGYEDIVHRLRSSQAVLVEIIANRFRSWCDANIRYNLWESKSLKWSQSSDTQFQCQIIDLLQTQGTIDLLQTQGTNAFKDTAIYCILYGDYHAHNKGIQFMARMFADLHLGNETDTMESISDFLAKHKLHVSMKYLQMISNEQNKYHTFEYIISYWCREHTSAISAYACNVPICLGTRMSAYAHFSGGVEDTVRMYTMSILDHLVKNKENDGLAWMTSLMLLLTECEEHEKAEELIFSKKSWFKKALMMLNDVLEVELGMDD
eukprot:242081_1